MILDTVVVWTEADYNALLKKLVDMEMRLRALEADRANAL